MEDELNSLTNGKRLSYGWLSSLRFYSILFVDSSNWFLWKALDFFIFYRPTLFFKIQILLINLRMCLESIYILRVKVDLCFSEIFFLNQEQKLYFLLCIFFYVSAKYYYVHDQEVEAQLLCLYSHSYPLST